MLQFLEAHGLDKDAKLSRERLGVMEATMTARAAAAAAPAGARPRVAFEAPGDGDGGAAERTRGDGGGRFCGEGAGVRVVGLRDRAVGHAARGSGGGFEGAVTL